MSVHITSLNRKKQYDFLYDDLAFEKLMRYYRFENEDDLLEFLKTQCILD
jgi:hypothetical protein